VDGACGGSVDRSPCYLVGVRRFFGMGAADFRSLRSDMYVRMQHFVRRSTTVPFRRLLGDMRREFMQRLNAELWVPICTTLWRAMLMLWHAFMFLVLRHVWLFPPCSFLLVGFHCLSCKHSENRSLPRLFLHMKPYIAVSDGCNMPYVTSTVLQQYIA
jgi:hypothetical protein